MNGSQLAKRRASRGFAVPHADALDTSEQELRQAPRLVPRPNVAEAFVGALAELGVQYAFGIFGGGIGPVCRALSESRIRLLHFRHEGGAAFAAIEASLASGRLVVVPVTTGPGLSNCYTGMLAARWEGAKVLFISGHTAADRRGRGAFQETSAHAPGLEGLFRSSSVLHYGAVVEHPAELAAVLAQLRRGVAQPGGFVAHVSIGLPQQCTEAPALPPSSRLETQPPGADCTAVARCLELLLEGPFVIWAGFGARHAAREVRELAERSGAKVMCSPRAKGVFPESHPAYLGVTGLGGHASVAEYLRREPPRRVLVLGTRMGEMTSFWSEELCPIEGFVHVDLDPEAFGAAYPDAPTVGIVAELRRFTARLAERWPSPPAVALDSPGAAFPQTLEPRLGRVRPSYLMQAIQREVVARTRAPILTEAGNAFAFGTHHLRFDEPLRYRVSTGFGSMGHAAAGVLGAALGAERKAVAVLGDGAMLMQNEINTAATYGIDAVWIVLNDGGYRMIAQGMEAAGWAPFETEFVRTDFVAIARGMGADGVTVDCESSLGGALGRAVAARGPFVVDVSIDPSERAPASHRNQSLSRQGLRG